jgi:hypothetical protein
LWFGSASTAHIIQSSKLKSRALILKCCVQATMREGNVAGTQGVMSSRI